MEMNIVSCITVVLLFDRIPATLATYCGIVDIESQAGRGGGVPSDRRGLVGVARLYASRPPNTIGRESPFPLFVFLKVG